MRMQVYSIVDLRPQMMQFRKTKSCLRVDSSVCFGGFDIITIIYRHDELTGRVRATYL